MKTFLYSISLAGILLLARPNGSSGRASFATPGKHRKIYSTLGNHEGHIQWVKIIPYQAIKGSSGAIVKGVFNYPLSKMTSWTYYDKYGDEVEDDQYDSQGNLHKKTYTYYPNGDIKEIIKDSNVRIGRRIIGRTHHHEICDHIQYVDTYKYKNFHTRYTYRYNAHGNLLYFLQRDYDSTSTTPFSSKLITFFYDSHGNMLDKYTYGKDTVHPYASTLYRYNEMGQLTEADEYLQTSMPGYFEDLAPTGKTIFTRNSKGLVIAQTNYLSQPGFSQDDTTTYDDSGDTLKNTERHYYFNGTGHVVNERIIKQYFKNTHTIREDIYGADGRLFDYSILHFDAENHLMDNSHFRIPYRNDTVMFNHTIYDPHCNETEEDCFYNDGKTRYSYTHQYKYDSHGNWVEDLWLTNGVPVQITEREIHYFPNH